MDWKESLQCPMPFLIGLNISKEQEEELEIPDDVSVLLVEFLIRKKVIRVYLDKGEIVYTEKLPIIPEKYSEVLQKR